MRLASARAPSRMAWARASPSRRTSPMTCSSPMVGLLDLEPEQDGHDETEDDDGLGDDGQHEALAEVLLVLGGGADGGRADVGLGQARADAGKAHRASSA